MAIFFISRVSSAKTDSFIKNDKKCSLRRAAFLEEYIYK